MAEDVMERIAREVRENPILIYMKGNRQFPQCGFSGATVRVFEELHVPFETRDVLQDPELRESIKRFSNWPTIPQVYIGGQFVGGCDIVRELYGTGELAELARKALQG